MKSMKRMLALLLALTMLMSMAACGQTSGQSAQAPQQDMQVPQQKPQQAPQQPAQKDELSREDQELIADLIGGEQNADQMSDEALDELIDQLLSDAVKEESSEIVNLGGNKEEQPTVDNSANADAYDNDGAMNTPFDQVYPELIENGQVAFADESLLIKLESGTLTAGLKAAGIGALEAIVPMKGATWYEAKLLAGVDPQTALAAVRQLDEVLLAEYNYEIQTAVLDEYTAFDAQTDAELEKNEHYKDQWHLHHCGIPTGYSEMETSGGDSSVVVAVIDSGVDYDHEDLKDNMWVNAAETPDNGIDDDGNGYIDDYYGVDLIAGKGSGDDDNGHGTHVAGIIAARNNNMGVVGVAYNVKIMAIKAAMHNGTLNQADIARAVLYAYEMGAEVINMSFGGSACSIAVQDALATAYTRCVLVASAGNSGYPNEPINNWPALPNYPAALTYVLGVMSVNEYGVESGFSNWDAYAFNGIEYELYAPGENIMSTLPGDRYGFLSGTSMAAPMVSAMAAILRSEFTDRDMYPTKFIYGQLASTSDYTAACGDPSHGLHNLPQIVNLNAALTKLPNPEVSLQDYVVFDSTDLSEKNNGDGVIDAGETIALGLTLRNRWGMSENTQVTIDTLENGISDPYVEILNDTVNYGSVGTYSTQDCGKIMADGIHIGWEDPFLIKIADNCPNDYRMTFHVHITCENALDEADETIYVAGDYPPININLEARNGVILPSIIDEDMVLTKDNLYIIPDSTVITEGTTVRVMPGTHIQFWSNDPNDAYAENAIAYLLVNGTFLVEGTKEEPVYIYPSELMDAYNVELGQGSTGYISLKYADISNLRTGSNSSRTENKIAYAERCTFRNIYGTKFYYRELYGTVVVEHTGTGGHMGTITEMKDCVFYKLGATTGYSEGWMSISGHAERCIFVECGMLYGNGGGFAAKECVFLGNNFVDQMYPDIHSLSIMHMKRDGVAELLSWYKSLPSYNSSRIVYRAETGTTYMKLDDFDTSDEGYTKDILPLVEKLGGSYAVVETPAEATWLYNNNCYSFYADISYDSEADTYYWHDGTPVADFLLPVNNYGNYDHWYVERGKLYYGTYVRTFVFEIPGPILPTDITFASYTVDIDTQVTYQLEPMSEPALLPPDNFLYESSDENVLTVSETGLVTPVGLGTADVWVWSLDKAVKNRVTFTVRDYVALEGLAFPTESILLEVGTTVPVSCILTPADTTRRDVVYTSSDPSVISVEGGQLRAYKNGTAIITATCEGLTATMEVDAWSRTEGIYFAESDRVTYDRAYLSVDTPELVISEGATVNLVWTSSKPEVANVVDGKLELYAAGYGTLNVVDTITGGTATVYFTITETAPTIDAAIVTAKTTDTIVALPAYTMPAGAEAEPQWSVMDPAVAALEDGAIRIVGEGVTTLTLTDPRTGLTDSISIYVTEGDVPAVKKLLTHFGYNSNYGKYNLVLLEDGRLYYWKADTSKLSLPILMCENVKAVDINKYSYAAVVKNDNTIECYGLGTDQASLMFTQTAVQELAIKDVVGYQSSNAYGFCFVLTEDGEVYSWEGEDQNYSNGFLGHGTADTTKVPTKITFNEPIKQVEVNQEHSVVFYLAESGNLYVTGGTSLKASTPVMIARNVTFLDEEGTWFVTNSFPAEFSEDATEPTIGTNDLSGFAVLDMVDMRNGIMAKDGVLCSFVTSSETESGRFEYFDVGSKIVHGGYCYGSYSFYYAITEDGLLFGSGRNCSGDSNYYNGLCGMSAVRGYVDDGKKVFIPLASEPETLTLLQTNLSEENVLTADQLKLTFNKQLLSAYVTLYENGTAMTVSKVFDENVLDVVASVGFAEGVTYKLVVSVADTLGVGCAVLTEDIELTFTYQAPEAETPDVEVPEEEPTEEPTEDTTEEPTKDTVEERVVYETITDETVVRYWTFDSLVATIAELQEQYQINHKFQGNVILNQFTTDDDVTHWLRPIAPEMASNETYKEIAIGGNYWGTSNEKIIEMQMVDYVDYKTYSRFMYAPYLTEAPENTFPFVTSVTLYNKYGEAVTTVGNEEVTFRVTFNRDMDTSIPLQLRFGSAYPYGDYEVEGAYVDARTWEGKYTLNTLIENGLQFITIENGCSATDDLALQLDRARFGFVIDTSAAQALLMQGHPTDTGIELTWTQDDFDTLMGYNVYRSTAEDGLYTRLNSTVIPAETMTWFDDTVEPGVQYYYNFTVVQTDLTESEPSGKIAIMSKDTMAPDIYHSPVVNAFTGANLVVSATVTDNLSIAYANLYYRVTGTDSWKTVRMNKLNDKYSAIIPAADVTVAGIEYYIEAFDGVSYTYKGSAETPYAIAVQEAVDANALGDVDGDGTITNRDALVLLYAINDKYNMTTEEFARADLNGDGVLWAAEALRILQYVNGTVGSLKMS